VSTKNTKFLDEQLANGEITQKQYDDAVAALPNEEEEKPKKSGIYTSTQISSNIPPASTLTANAEDPKLWIENKVKEDVLAGNQDVNTLAIPEGPSGKYFVALKNFATDNGLRLSDGAATSYANSIAAGTIDENTAFNALRESAAEAFPALADKIKAGINLKTLADPYIQSMSDILEIPDSGIDLFDPKVRSALAYTLPDGKVGTKSIYDFEKELRKDPRWQYTNNARNDAASVASTVLKDFGFMG